MGPESWVWFLLVLAIVGLIVGAVARVLVPGPTPLGILGTIGVGIAGAFRSLELRAFGARSGVGGRAGQRPRADLLLRPPSTTRSRL
jgi:uncharacterized membrane protein YeaQ/YmgE (transglycosylase-associated protein family)